MDNGIIARWGGHEFTGYLYGSEIEVCKIVDCIYQSIVNGSQLKVYPITISASTKIDTVDTLLSRADKALYEAKEKGRNRYFIYK